MPLLWCYVSPEAIWGRKLNGGAPTPPPERRRTREEKRWAYIYNIARRQALRITVCLREVLSSEVNENTRHRICWEPMCTQSPSQSDPRNPLSPYHTLFHSSSTRSRTMKSFWDVKKVEWFDARLDGRGCGVRQSPLELFRLFWKFLIPNASIICIFVGN